MAVRNWATRIYSFQPNSGNANSVYLGSPDPSTTLRGTSHSIIEMAGHFDKVQLVFMAQSVTNDVVILGANAIAPNSLADTVQDAAFATAKSFTFNGSSGVTVPLRTLNYGNMVLSDPMDLTSVDRVDIVGARPLLGFRILLSLAGGNFEQVTYFIKSGTDWGTVNPIGYHSCRSGDKLTTALGATPTTNGNAATIGCIGVRYLSRKRAMSVMWVGDSLTACSATTYTTMKAGGYPLKSAVANSTLANPIEWINCGMATQSASQYQAAATYLMPQVYPTHIVEEFLSPNTLSPGSIAAGIATCVAEQATVFSNAATIGAVRTMWNGLPECTSAACTASVYNTSDDALRVTAMTTQAGVGYPTLNLNDTIKTNTAPQLIQSTSNGFATDFSGDGLHPNQAADDQQLSPAATTFIAGLASTFWSVNPMAFQVRIPGSNFMNGITGSFQYRIPGYGFISERTSSSGGRSGTSNDYATVLPMASTFI